MGAIGQPISTISDLIWILVMGVGLGSCFILFSKSVSEVIHEMSLYSWMRLIDRKQTFCRPVYVKILGAMIIIATIIIGVKNI